MKIALCSDSHNGTFHIDLFIHYCKTEKIEQVFHMGDVTEDARLMASELDIPVVYIAGNCDFFDRSPREKIIELEGHRIMLTHGDRWGVKTQLNSLRYHADEEAVDIVCFGHTHRPTCVKSDNVYMINPGALKDGKIVILELDGDSVQPTLIDIDIWEQERRNT